MFLVFFFFFFPSETSDLALGHVQKSNFFIDSINACPCEAFEICYHKPSCLS